MILTRIILFCMRAIYSTILLSGIYSHICCVSMAKLINIIKKQFIAAVTDESHEHRLENSSCAYWDLRLRSLLSRVLWWSRIHGCRSLFRSYYFSADRKSAKGLRVAEHSVRPEIKRGQLHEERLKLLKLIRVIADEVQSCVR